MTWLIVLRRFWDEKIVKYTVLAGSVIFALLLYGAAKKREGVKQEKRKDAIRDQEKLEAINEASDAAGERADAVSVNSGSYDDDRVSDKPLPDHHYRD